MTKLTTTLNAIRQHSPCEDGWRNLLDHLGKTKADDEPVSFRTILESNGLNDALWCLRALPPEMDSAVRLLVCDLVEPAMVYVPDGETRPQAAIDAARAYARCEITAEDLAAASDAALDAALDVASDAVMATALDAVMAIASDAASDAAWAAALDAERDAAWAAARADQERIFVAWLDKMENDG